MSTASASERPCRRWPWVASTVLLALALAATLYVFLVAGRAEAPQGVDQRTVLRLAPAERHLILGEMRQFLAGVQTMSTALAREDMELVARTARSLGSAAAAGVPPTLMGKLPLGFKRLGLSVHRDFDRIAMDAQSLGDPAHTQAQLGRTLASCVTCHSAYQIRSGAAPGAAQEAPQ